MQTFVLKKKIERPKEDYLAAKYLLAIYTVENFNELFKICVMYANIERQLHLCL